MSWLQVPAGRSWLDFGCGTGALTQTVLAMANPGLVVGCDRSGAYAAFAARQTPDPRARLVTAGLTELPTIPGGFDTAVAGLVLNFLPDPLAGLCAIASRTHPGATVGGYVWDYAEGMQLLRYFWDTATAGDAAARALDEGVTFPLCRPAPFRALFENAGLRHVEVEEIIVPTIFRNFDDLWAPFLEGQGPAPGYVAGLSPAGRAALREQLRSRLPIAANGAIHLTARAWAAKGVVS